MTARVVYKPARHEPVKNYKLVSRGVPLYGVNWSVLVEHNLVALSSRSNKIEQRLTIITEDRVFLIVVV